VVVLRMLEGYSTRETADLLDIPQGTVMSRLSRALDKLEALLTPVLYADVPSPD
jgi:RNA polymerase sigma-70 factor (ECF subfamily)